MKIFKKIVKVIIGIPNLPFQLMCSVYVIVKIIKETGINEFSMVTKEDLENNVELKNYIKNLYPLSISYMIALLFYTYIVLNIYLF